ncbi:diguanylate cyclase [Conexibacter sp. SYSU D00693]|uniref:GGDEF domain-containing protein n=1 Tax=Conexibacter sp. SYSU D00693 TaxID=2812560 RepID=UPI00196B2767|nr:MASE1 domain-containing protein [Conexibacter sp. SYSU D00693]
MSRRRHTPAGLLLANLALALAYLATARLGMGLALVADNVTPVWPPAAIALVALVLGRGRLVPGILAGALAAHLSTGLPVVTAVAMSLGNLGAGLLAAALLRRADFRPRLDRVRDVVALGMLAAVISTAVAATAGVGAMWAAHLVHTDGLWAASHTWWAGDMVAELVLAPLLFLLLVPGGVPPLRGREVVHMAAVFAAGTAAAAIAISGDLAYLVFPVLAWGAVRFRQFGAAASGLLVAIVAVLLTANGIGDFADDWLQQDVTRSQMFMGVAAVSALLLAAMKDELLTSQTHALTDALTGLANRRGWELELAHQEEAGRRGRRSFSIVLLDLDGFKAYNDAHGHQAGDRLLREVAGAWADRLRATDVLARFGGDEFGVVLAGCDLGAAEGLSAQLRAATPDGCGVSTGCAWWDGQESVHAVVARADRALYAAKADRGRLAVPAAQARRESAALAAAA